MTQTARPLTESQRTKITEAICRSWFGNRESQTIETAFDENVTVTLTHTEDDNIEFAVTIQNPEERSIDDWPDKLNDLGPYFVKLVAALGAIIGETFNEYRGKLKFYKPPCPFWPKPVYKANLDLKDLQMSNARR